MKPHETQHALLTWTMFSPQLLGETSCWCPADLFRILLWHVKESGSRQLFIYLLNDSQPTWFQLMIKKLWVAVTCCTCSQVAHWLVRVRVCWQNNHCTESWSYFCFCYFFSFSWKKAFVVLAPSYAVVDWNHFYKLTVTVLEGSSWWPGPFI